MNEISELKDKSITKQTTENSGYTQNNTTSNLNINENSNNKKENDIEINKEESNNSLSIKPSHHNSKRLTFSGEDFINNNINLMQNYINSSINPPCNKREERFNNDISLGNSTNEVFFLPPSTETKKFRLEDSQISFNNENNPFMTPDKNNNQQKTSKENIESIKERLEFEDKWQNIEGDFFDLRLKAEKNNSSSNSISNNFIGNSASISNSNPTCYNFVCSSSGSTNTHIIPNTNFIHKNSIFDDRESDDYLLTKFKSSPSHNSKKYYSNINESSRASAHFGTETREFREFGINDFCLVEAEKKPYSNDFFVNYLTQKSKKVGEEEANSYKPYSSNYLQEGVSNINNLPKKQEVLIQIFNNMSFDNKESYRSKKSNTESHRSKKSKISNKEKKENNEIQIQDNSNFRVKPAHYNKKFSFQIDFNNEKYTGNNSMDYTEEEGSKHRDSNCTYKSSPTTNRKKTFSSAIESKIIKADIKQSKKMGNALLTAKNEVKILENELNKMKLKLRNSKEISKLNLNYKKSNVVNNSRNNFESRNKKTLNNLDLMLKKNNTLTSNSRYHPSTTSSNTANTSKIIQDNNNESKFYHDTEISKAKSSSVEKFCSLNKLNKLNSLNFNCTTIPSSGSTRIHSKNENTLSGVELNKNLYSSQEFLDIKENYKKNIKKYRNQSQEALDERRREIMLERLRRKDEQLQAVQNTQTRKIKDFEFMKKERKVYNELAKTVVEEEVKKKLKSKVVVKLDYEEQIKSRTEFLNKKIDESKSNYQEKIKREEEKRLELLNQLNNLKSKVGGESYDFFTDSIQNSSEFIVHDSGVPHLHNLQLHMKKLSEDETSSTKAMTQKNKINHTRLNSFNEGFSYSTMETKPKSKTKIKSSNFNNNSKKISHTTKTSKTFNDIDDNEVKYKKITHNENKNQKIMNELLQKKKLTNKENSNDFVFNPINSYKKESTFKKYSKTNLSKKGIRKDDLNLNNKSSTFISRNTKSDLSISNASNEPSLGLLNQTTQVQVNSNHKKIFNNKFSKVNNSTNYNSFKRGSFKLQSKKEAYSNTSIQKAKKESLIIQNSNNTTKLNDSTLEMNSKKQSTMETEGNQSTKNYLGIYSSNAKAKTGTTILTSQKTVKTTKPAKGGGTSSKYFNSTKVFKTTSLSNNQPIKTKSLFQEKEK